MASSQRPVALRKAGKRSFDNEVRLAEPACTFLAAGHVAGGRPDKGDAACPKPCEILLCRRMAPHRRVHCRCHQHRCRGRKEDRRRKVVRKPVRRARHQVRCRRRHQHEIGFAGEADMSHLGLVGQREQVRIGFFAGQGGQAERGDELPRPGGHHAGNGNIVVLQPPRHFQRLVGGDPAADDQQHAAPAVPRAIASTDDGEASRVDMIAARLERGADRRMGMAWQFPARQIVADRAGTDAEKVLERLPPAKSGDKRWQITFVHFTAHCLNWCEIT